jgi:hypothetical protein
MQCDSDSFESCDNISQTDGTQSCDNIFQLDGNESCDSLEDSYVNYESDSEIDSRPVRAVLVPAQPQPGQPFSLEVGCSDTVDAPSSLPLSMVLNCRSAYNKTQNLKRSLSVIGLDLLVALETWERP